MATRWATWSAVGRGGCCASGATAVGVGGWEDTSISDDGGVSAGGVVSIGESIGDVVSIGEEQCEVQHGYFFLANSLVAKYFLPTVGTTLPVVETSPHH